MSIYKFKPGDILYNRVETHPKCEFVLYDGNIYYNNKTAVTGAFVDNAGMVPVGYLSLYEYNVDRDATGNSFETPKKIFPYITKQGTLMSFSTVSNTDFQSFPYGDVITGSYPLSSSLANEFYALNASRPRITALKNTLNYYRYLSNEYAFGDKGTEVLQLVSIPSIFYGSSIEKGTVDMRFYITGTLAAQLVDEKKNGDLIQVGPAGSANSGSVAGVVLYNEGFCVLTGAWSLDDAHTETYVASPDNPRWIYWGQNTNLITGSAYTIKFNGTNYIPTVTMLAHAPEAELNNSNNPTWVSFVQPTGSKNPITGGLGYTENKFLEIKNTVKSPHLGATANFEKHTYISKVGIFDEDRNLIGIAKVATPVKKTEQRNYTFKLKLDF